MAELHIIREDAPQRGYVLEYENDSEVGLNLYRGSGDGKTLKTPESVKIFDIDELMSQVNGDVRALNRIVKPFTKGQKFYVREMIAHFFDKID